MHALNPTPMIQWLTLRSTQAHPWDHILQSAIETKVSHSFPSVSSGWDLDEGSGFCFPHMFPEKIARVEMLFLWYVKVLNLDNFWPEHVSF